MTCLLPCLVSLMLNGEYMSSVRCPLVQHTAWKWLYYYGDTILYVSVCLSVCLSVSLYIYATVLCVGQSDIPFSSAARNLCVTFDSQLALKEQVNKLRQLALPGDQAGQFNPTLPFILKSARLSFPLLFSPGWTTVMLSLLALLGFSLRKLKERSTV